MTLHLKKKIKKFQYKMKLYRTSEFISNDISFEKNSLQQITFSQFISPM